MKKKYCNGLAMILSFAAGVAIGSLIHITINAPSKETQPEPVEQPDADISFSDDPKDITASIDEAYKSVEDACSAVEQMLADAEAEAAKSAETEPAEAADEAEQE